MKDKKKRMYVSLPITGRRIESVKRFAKAVKDKWIDLGFDVITPFDVNPLEGMPYNYYMGRDVEALLACDGIILCDGWFQSKGCRAECSVAEIYKKIIKTDNTMYEEDKV